MTKLTWTSISDILRARAAGVTRAELAAAYGVTGEAIRYWKRYAGLQPEWIERVKGLEILNKRLSRRCVELSEQQRVGASVIKQFVPSARKRSLISPALQAQFCLDRRSANAILGLTADAGVMKRTQRDDTQLIAAMRLYAEANPGQGFAKMFKVILQHQPGTRHHALRVYTENKLRVADRPKKIPVPRRVSRPMKIQGNPDVVWSMDFMMDVLPSGQRFWVLNIIDDFNREALAIRVVKRHTAGSVIEALEEVRRNGRLPKCIRTDNGKEFKSAAYLDWIKRNRANCVFTGPYRATENAYVERFNRTLRAEALSCFLFKNLAEVQRMVEDWRIRYNVSRPHHALGGLSPVQYAYAARQPLASSRRI